MKQIINQFTNGLVSDMHPLTTDDKGIVDALNATLITYNGNEMILQNDMGNTRIQDSATGNIMGLSPGFIPLGLKEHGGIMYIASVNKDGYGEIGTIPSPIIRDIYKDKVSIPFNTTIPIDTGDPIQITNKLYPADKFIANLQMEIDPDKLKGKLHTKHSDLSGQKNDPCDIVLERQIYNGLPIMKDSVYFDSLYSPVISYSTNSEDAVCIDGSDQSTNIRKKGIYKLNLYSSPEEGKSVIASENLLSSQAYGPNGENKSQYWFLHTNFPTTVFPKDLFNATLNKDLKQVPVSNKPGKLAIELIPESITDFGMLPRKDKQHVPITYKTNDGEYHTYFPGFYYTSDNGLYIEKLTARVIDESTNLEVDLVYPYDKEVLFDRFNLSGITFKSPEDGVYSEEFCNGDLKLWDVTDELGLPHQRSNDYPNTQILSPIVGLLNHTQTSFKSSTQGKDDSPHSGVFYADLGNKYQNWYRLEIDYEDQYGGNKGTFTTRFNPYMNDVFGTNLGIDGIELATTISMKPKKVKYEKTYTDSGSFKSVYKLPNVYVFGTSVNFRDAYPSFSIGKNYMYDSKNSSSDIINTITVDKIPKSNQIAANDVCNNYSYLASSYIVDDKVSYDDSFEKIWTPAQMSSIVFSGLTDFNGKWFLTSNKVFGGIYSKVLGGDVYLLHAVVEGHLSDTVNMILNPNKHDDDVIFNDGSYALPFMWASHDDIKNQDISHFSGFEYEYQFDIQGNQLNLKRSPTVEYSIKSFKNSFGDATYTDDHKFQYYFNAENSSNITAKPCDMTYLPQISIIHNVNINLQKTVTFNSFYSVIPYFCLTGTNDEGKQVYVQRFGKNSNTDIVYQHNFEYKDGEIKNYFDNSFSKPTKSELIQCSYNHATPFWYYNEHLDYRTNLNKGIYILNITRVPGKAYEQDNFFEESNVKLFIEIGSNKTEVKDWVTFLPDYSSGLTNASDPDNGNYIQPIVIIIRENTDIRIYTEGEGTLCYQSIGLFKTKKSDPQFDLLYTATYNENILAYNVYMNRLLWYTELSDLSKIEQYNFIQEHGIFFKEAYVFIDGLVNDHNQIRGITIENISYGAYPYIPSDPSILPVNLNTKGGYTWNAYVMPESVLNSGQDNFVFSNPLNGYIFSTKPDPKGLRQLIEQQN